MTPELDISDPRHPDYVAPFGTDSVPPARSTRSIDGWLKAIQPPPKEKGELTTHEHAKLVASRRGISSNLVDQWDLVTKHVPKATGPSQEDHGRASAQLAGIPTPDTDYFRKALEPQPESNEPDIVQASVVKERPITVPPVIWPAGNPFDQSTSIPKE